jgi:hypothetical protein
MSKEVIVELKLQVDQAGQQAKAVRDELKSVEDAAKKAGDSGQQAGEKTAKGFGEADKSVAAASKSVGQLFNNLLKSAGINLDPLISQFKTFQAALLAVSGATTAATRSTGLLSGAMRILRVALISTGIGAIVVALGALAAALFTTQRGTDALNKVLTPLKVILQTLLGVLQDVGFAIVDAFKNPQQAVKDLFEVIKENIFNRLKAIIPFFGAIGTAIKEGLTGNLEGVKKAAIEAGQAFVQFTTGLDTEQQNNLLNKTVDLFEKAADKARQLNEIGIQLRQLAIERAKEEGKLQLIFQEQSLEAANTLNTLEQRKAAGEAAIEAARKLSEFAQRENELLIKQLEIKQSFNDTNDEELAQLEELRSKRETIQAQFLASTRRVQSQINNAIKGQQAAEAAAAEARKKIEQEIADEITKIRNAQKVAGLDEFEARRKAAEIYFKELLEREGATAEQQLEIRRLYEAELARINLDEAKKILEREQELQEGLRVLRLEGVDIEIEAVKNKYAALLELAKDNADATAEIEQKMQDEITEIYKNAEAQRAAAAAATAASSLQAVSTVVSAISQLYKEQGEESKALALTSILINTAAGIAGAVAAGSTLVFPANLAAIAAGIAAVLGGIAQARQVLNSAPSFAEGTEYLQRGNNPSGTDTIPIWADEGEAIIPRKRNAQYKGLAKAFRTGSVDEWVNRYYFADRVANMKVIHSNVSTSSLNDKNIVVGLRHVKRTQEETNYLLTKLAKSNRFKRAG